MPVPVPRLRTIEKYVLVVTTGRSGSSFFSNLVNENAVNAFSEHEPNLVAGDVSTQWYYDGEDAKIDHLVVQKLRRLRRGELIRRIPGGTVLQERLSTTRFESWLPKVPVEPVYVEVDNGALKSWGPAMLDAVPALRVVHLTRHPLIQARSAENRRSEPNPDRPYFLWPAWNRNVLRLDDSVVGQLSRFQLALWYWIEMELRYTAFFADVPSGPNVEIDVEELNDAERVEELFDALGIEYGDINLSAGRNLGPRKSVVSDEDYAQAAQFLELIPAQTLDRISNTYGLEAL